MRRLLLVVVGGLVAATASPAAADGEATATYLTDGGALPLIWAPLAGALVLDPDLVRNWDRASVISTTAGFSLAVGMLATRDGSAPYHVKGLVQSAVTSAVLTSGFDAVSGRKTAGTSGAFAVGTYTALYLRRHVLHDVRPALQIAAYSAIGIGTMAIAAERALRDGRDWSDIAIGAVLGTTTSTLLYLYQEHRFDKRVKRELKIRPTFSNGVPGLSVVGTF